MLNIIEFITVALIVVLAVFLSLLQTLVYWLQTPPGTIFPFIHNYISDYYYYLHLMRQGFEGHWLATSWLTPEVFPPQFVNPFFIILGHLSRVTRISLPLMYTLSRGIGGIGLGIGIYLLSRAWFGNDKFWRVLGLIITIFSTSFWSFSGGKLSPPELVHTWTEFDPMFRLSYIPHHLWSKVFLVLLFVLVNRWQDKINLRRLITLGLFTLLIGFTSPVTLITFIPTICLWQFLSFARPGLTKLKFSKYVKNLTIGLVTVGIAVLIALYHKQIEHSVFPWTSYSGWEGHVQFTITPLNYLQSLGPTAILFLFALPVLWRRSLGRLFIAWAVSGWLGTFILATILPLSNIRFLEGYQWIPLGIGAAVGVKQIIERTVISIPLVWREATKKRFLPASRRVEMTIICVMLTYFSIGFYASWQEHAGYIVQNKTNPQVYMPQSWLEPFKVLEKAGKPQDVVLAPPEMSPLIPAFTGKRVVWAHDLMTLNASEKLSDLRQIYLTTNPEQIWQIITKHNADYLVFMSQSLAGPHYQLIWNQGELGIYKVLKSEN